MSCSLTNTGSNSDNESNAGVFNVNSNNELSNANGNVSTLEPYFFINKNELLEKTLPLGKKRHIKTTVLVTFVNIQLRFSDEKI